MKHELTFVKKIFCNVNRKNEYKFFNFMINLSSYINNIRKKFLKISFFFSAFF